jgi:hypothetical protein
MQALNLHVAPNFVASSTSVRSPFAAARATFALKLGEWLRRGRLLMFCSFAAGHSITSGSRDSTYRPVQISGARSSGGTP